MEEATAGVYLVSINRSRYSTVSGGTWESREWFSCPGALVPEKAV
jgi:hypothetical protein